MNKMAAALALWIFPAGFVAGQEARGQITNMYSGPSFSAAGGFFSPNDLPQVSAQELAAIARLNVNSTLETSLDASDPEQIRPLAAWVKKENLDPHKDEELRFAYRHLKTYLEIRLHDAREFAEKAYNDANATMDKGQGVDAAVQAFRIIDALRNDISAHRIMIGKYVHRHDIDVAIASIGNSQMKLVRKAALKFGIREAEKLKSSSFANANMNGESYLEVPAIRH